MEGEQLVSQKLLYTLFPEDNELDEQPMHIAKCKKISRVGFRHERIVILSTHNIYIVNSKSAVKKLPIDELKFMVKSLVS
jgi:hypothetical protein